MVMAVNASGGQPPGRPRPSPGSALPERRPVVGDARGGQEVGQPCRGAGHPLEAHASTPPTSRLDSARSIHPWWRVLAHATGGGGGGPGGPVASPRWNRRPAVLPPTAGRAGRRPQRTRRPPDGELRLPDRRPGDRRGPGGRPRLRRRRHRRRSRPPTACAVTGALATHYHPDHVGGEMMGYRSAGWASCWSRTRCPSTSRGRGAVGPAGDRGVLSRPRAARSGRRGHGGRGRHRADPHARPHARQPVLLRRRALPGARATRCSSRAAGAPTCPAATPPSSTRA